MIMLVITKMGIGAKQNNKSELTSPVLLFLTKN